MTDQNCILCRRPYPAGLHVGGCLICFHCEKRLLQGVLPQRKRKRLRYLFPRAPILQAQRQI